MCVYMCERLCVWAKCVHVFVSMCDFIFSVFKHDICVSWAMWPNDVTKSLVCLL